MAAFPSPGQLDPRPRFEDGSGPIAEGEAAKRKVPEPGNGIVIDPDDLDIHDGGPYNDKLGTEPDEYQADAAPARPQLAVVTQPTPQPQLVSDSGTPPEPLNPELLKAMRERLGPSLDTEYKASVAKREEAAGLSELQERARALGIEIAPETTAPGSETGFAIDDDDSTIERSLKSAYNVIAPFIDGASAVAKDIGTGLTTDAANIVIGGPMRAYKNALNLLTEARNGIRGWLKSQIGEERFAQLEAESGEEMAKVLGQTYMEELRKVQAAQDSGKGAGDLTVERMGPIGSESVVGDAQSVTGQLAQSITQFMTGFLIGGAPGTIVGGALKGMAVDFAAFDGNDGNFANLIQMLPGAEQNAVLEFLATDESTPEIEGRLKNSLTGAIGGVAAEAVFAYARAYRARRKARELAGVETDEDVVKRGSRTINDADLVEGRPVAESDVGQRVSQMLGGDPEDLAMRLERRLKPIDLEVPTEMVARSIAADIPRMPPPQPGYVRLWAGSKDNVRDNVGKPSGYWRAFYTTPEEAVRGTEVTRMTPDTELTYVEIPATKLQQIREQNARRVSGVGRTADTTDAVAIRVRDFAEGSYPSWIGDPNRGAPLIEGQRPARPPRAEPPTARPDASDGIDESDYRAIKDMADYVREFRRQRPPTRLTEFLRSQGGVQNQGDEIRSILGGTNQRPGLIHQGGLPLDEAARRAWDAGYLDGVDRPDISVFLDRLRDDLGTTPVYSMRDGEYVDDLRVVEDMENELGRLGISARSTEQAIRQAIADSPDFKGTSPGGPQATSAAEGAARPGVEPPPVPAVIESPFFNFNRINSLDDLKATIRDMAEAFKEDFDVTKGVRSFKQVEKEANGVDAFSVLVRDRKGGLPSDAETFALRRLHAASAEKLKEVARAALTGGPAEEFALMRMIQVHRLVQAEVKNIATAYARGLAQFRMSAGGGKEQALQIQQILERTGGSAAAKRIAMEINNVPDIPQAGMILDKAVRDMSDRRLTADIVGEVWRNAILSGPKTHMVNIMSNLLVAQYAMLERAVAGAFGHILDPVTGVKLQEAAIMSYAQNQAMKELWTYIWRTSLSKAKLAKTAEGEPDLFARYKDQFDKTEQPYSRALSSERMRLDPNSVQGRALDLLGSFVNVPGTALGGADVLFKFVNERMQLHALASRTALEEMERGLISSADVKKRIADIVDDPPEDIRIAARNYAAVQTFTSDPGPIARSIIKFKSDVDDFSGRNVGVPVGTLILPFVNTPANILTYTFDRTPLAPLGAKFRAAVAAGGAERDLALARVALGSTIAMVAFDMAMDGHITGGGPSDYKQKAALRRNGWQPYSVRLQTGQNEDGTPIYRYFAVNRMDPVGSWLVLAAEAAEVARNNGGRIDPELNEYFAAITFGIANIVTEKTYLTGVSRVMDAINHPDRSAEFWVNSMAGSFVPSGVREWARASDPIARHAWDMASAMRARVPELSKDLPPRLDFWGREIKFQSGLGTTFDVMSPIYSDSTERAQPIDRVMIELNYFPTNPTTFLMDGKTVPLRNMPAAKNTWITLRSATPASELIRNNTADISPSIVRKLSLYGNDTLLETLNKMVQGRHPTLSFEYEQQDGDGKRQLIQQVIGHYNRGAKPQVLRQHPEIQEAWDRIPTQAERGKTAPF